MGVHSWYRETDAVPLSIVTINPKGARKEVTVNKIDFTTKSAYPSKNLYKTNNDIGKLKTPCTKQLFSYVTGKSKVQESKNAVPIIQPRRTIPLHYVDRLERFKVDAWWRRHKVNCYHWLDGHRPNACHFWLSKCKRIHFSYAWAHSNEYSKGADRFYKVIWHLLISLKLKNLQESCISLECPGVSIDVKVWWWVQAQQVVKYNRKLGKWFKSALIQSTLRMS